MRCRRHAAWYLALAEASRRGLRGPDQVAWLADMAADEQNLRAALAWAVDRTAAETALRLVWALEVFWVRAARDDEAAQWLDRALALDCPTQPMLRARALATGGVFATKTQRSTSPIDASAKSIRPTSARGDDGLAFALRGLAWLYEARGEAAAAFAPLEESITLFSALGHPIATRLCDLGNIALAQDDRERARSSYERAVEAGETRGTPADRHRHSPLSPSSRSPKEICSLRSATRDRLSRSTSARGSSFDRSDLPACRRDNRSRPT